MISESAVKDMWQLDWISKTDCHWGISLRPRTEPATPGSQIWWSPYLDNRADILSVTIWNSYISPAIAETCYLNENFFMEKITTTEKISP